MSNIKKEQIVRLENVGLSIIDSINDDYNEIVKADNDKRKKMNSISNDLKRIADTLREGGNNAG